MRNAEEKQRIEQTLVIQPNYDIHGFICIK